MQHTLLVKLNIVQLCLNYYFILLVFYLSKITIGIFISQCDIYATVDILLLQIGENEQT